MWLTLGLACQHASVFKAPLFSISACSAAEILTRRALCETTFWQEHWQVLQSDEPRKL
jgi:hypothetical protein